MFPVGAAGGRTECEGITMKRRTFLEVTVAVAGTLVFTPACGSSNEPGGKTPDQGDPLFPQSLASGDPRQTSVVLWTRVEDPDHLKDDLTLTLEVATDSGFKSRVQLDGKADKQVTAVAASDHCVKVRVTQLEPGKQYYYRFSYDKDGKTHTTRVGRTRTAPAPDADVPVKFAVVSCQDYVGKYYHVYRRIAEEDLDFIVHLGDYIYETTGDPSFQNVGSDRKVTFSDTAGAIQLGDPPNTYLAAQSLSNYRELYRTYRSDPDQQLVHEQMPMIVMWDDHEFSDDCHGDVATYFDGEKDETEPKRRANADQAWFEYMPVDYDYQGHQDYPYDPSKSFPDSFRIYRDFTFGKHVHLVMTDLRRYRSDHLIPEDAFPGAVAMAQADLPSPMPSIAEPYVDIDAHDGGSYATLLKQHATALGMPASGFTGNISVPWINALVDQINKANGTSTAPIDDTDPTLEKGIAFYQMMKVAPYSSIGSRYLVKKPAFDLYAAFRFKQSSGQSEVGMGDEQRQWFLSTVQGSQATWKVWGNEYTFMPRVIDLRTATQLGASFQALFNLSAEDWDGMPNRREQLLEQLAQVQNFVAVTGDIHSFFAGSPYVAGDMSKRIVEFVAGSISSSTYRTLLQRQAASTPALVEAGAADLAAVVDKFLTDSTAKPNPHLAWLDLADNGYASVVADGKTFSVTFRSIPEATVETAPGKLSGTLDSQFTDTEFKVDSGNPTVQQKRDGKWQSWDPAKFAWV
jgi:alkaline phosphatase D